jgi:hypothetical protein
MTLNACALPGDCMRGDKVQFMLHWNAVSTGSIPVIDDELDTLEIVTETIIVPIIIVARQVIAA